LPVFVTISEGPSAGQARPVLVLDDPGVARALAELIAKRFSAAPPARPLHPARGPGAPDDGEKQ
jgi:hypothetical protein